MLVYAALAYLAHAAPPARFRRSAVIDQYFSVRGEEVADSTRLVIDKGRRIEWVFTLAAGTTWSNCEKEEGKPCSITVSITNTRPDQVTLSRCFVRWLEGDTSPKKVWIMANDNFRDEGEIEFPIKTEPAVSGLKLFNELDIPDVTLRTKPRPTGNCRSVTDPNYRMWDGTQAVNNQDGTLVLWKSDWREWEVQSRVRETYNCAVGVRDGCQRIVIDRCSGSVIVRKYFTGARSEHPRVTKSGNKYTILSQRHGGRVVIDVNTRTVRTPGRQICGWSGCRTVWVSTTTKWMDINMWAPSSDWGWEDDADASRTVSRTRGVCGTFNSNRTDDQSIGAAINTFIIPTHKSIIQPNYRMPSPCVGDDRPPIDPEGCKVPQVPFSVPIIATVDVEDITSSIKTAQASDDSDPRQHYDFVPNPTPPEILNRTVQFKANARTFCRAKLETTQVWSDCLVQGHTEEDMKAFLDDCQNDVEIQGDPNAFTPDEDGNFVGMNHEWLAEATYEDMVQTCVARGAGNPGVSGLVCPEKALGCQTVCFEGKDSNCTCIGADCVAQALPGSAGFADLVGQVCPNNCNKDNGQKFGDTIVSPGQCVTNAENKRVCLCDERFEGDDCSLRKDDQIDIEAVFPFSCATNLGVGCPADVAISGSLLPNTGQGKCRWWKESTPGNNDWAPFQVLDAMYMPANIYRCPLPANTDRAAGESTVEEWRVDLSLDGGKLYSVHPLAFTFHDSTCFECFADGDCDLKAETCFIDERCYVSGQKRASSGAQCATCDPLQAKHEWTVDDALQDCGLQLDTETWLGRSVSVAEDAVKGTHLDASDQIFSVLNPQGLRPVRWLVEVMQGDANTFTIHTNDRGDTAFLVLEKELNFETRSSYLLKVTAKSATGSSEDSMEISVTVRDADEATSLSVTPSLVALDENQPAMFAGAVASFTDPDSGEAFGDVSLDLRGVHAPKFELRPVPGADSEMQIWTAGPLNAETSTGVLTVDVVATTDSNQEGVTATLSFTVTDLPEAPVAMELSPGAVSETTAVDSVATTVVVHDPDENSSVKKMEIVAQKPAGLFKVSASDPTKLLVAKPLDYSALTETAGAAGATVKLTLKVTDNDGLEFQGDVSLKVDDANTAPTGVTVVVPSTGAELSTLPENTVVNTAVGTLVAVDQDANDQHTFELCPYADDTTKCTDERVAQGFPSFPLQVYGKSLFLRNALDFEAPNGQSVTFCLRAIDDQVCTGGAGVTVNCGLASPWDCKAITVTNSEDVPRDFTVKLDPEAVGYVSKVDLHSGFLAHGIVEGVAGAVVGSVTAQNQDKDKPFTIMVSDSDHFEVGATTCEQTAEEQTRCMAPLRLVKAVDFEGSNRIAADASEVPVTFVGKPDDLAAASGTEIVKIPVVNVNEPPSAVLVVYPDGSAAPGTKLNAQTGNAVVGMLTVSDPDLCDTDGAACRGASSADAFKFELVGSTDDISLRGCGELMSAVEAMQKCSIQIATLPIGAKRSFMVRVVDQDGASVETQFEVTVVEAVLSLALVDAEGNPVTEIPEYNGDAYGDSGVSLKVSGWTGSQAPEPVLIDDSAVIFEFGDAVMQPQRRRDASTYLIKLNVMEPAMLDFESAEEVEVMIKLENEEWHWTVKIVDAAIELERVELCTDVGSKCKTCAGQACTIEILRASEKIDPAQHLVVKGSDGAAWKYPSTFGSIVVVADDGSVSLRQSPAAAQMDAMTRNVFSGTARRDGEQLDFKLAVAVTCPEGSSGRTCSTFDADPSPPGVPGANDAEETSDDSLSSSGIAAVVIGLVILIAVLVGAVMWKLNKERKDMEVIQGLDSKPLFVQGQSNPMYGWYQPKATKEDADAELSSARPGAFVVRDCGEKDPGVAVHALHAKTPQAVIVDEFITTSGNGCYEVMEPNQPRFDSLPELVSYYGRPQQTDLPFTLALDNPMYGMMAGADELYDNAAIKNSLEVQDAPMLPVKIVSATAM